MIFFIDPAMPGMRSGRCLPPKGGGGVTDINRLVNELAATEMERSSLPPRQGGSRASRARS